MKTMFGRDIQTVSRKEEVELKRKTFGIHEKVGMKMKGSGKMVNDSS